MQKRLQRQARHWELTPVILATQEAEIRRIARPISKNPITKKRAGGVAQDVGPEFKSQHCKKKQRKRNSRDEIPNDRRRIFKELRKIHCPPKKKRKS
jgi:hypothetical protein